MKTTIFSVLLLFPLLPSVAYSAGGGNPIDFLTENASRGEVTIKQDAGIVGIPSYAGPGNPDTYDKVTVEWDPVVLADYRTAEVNIPPTGSRGGGVARSGDFAMVWQINSGDELNSYVMVDSWHLCETYPLKQSWHYTYATTDSNLGADLFTEILPDWHDPDFDWNDTILAHGEMGFDAMGWTTAPGSTLYALHGPDDTYEIPIRFGKSWLFATYLPDAPGGKNWTVGGIIYQQNPANPNYDIMLPVNQQFTHAELSNKTWSVFERWDTSQETTLRVSAAIERNQQTPISHECEASSDDNPLDYTTRLERKFMGKGFVNLKALTALK